MPSFLAAEGTHFRAASFAPSVSDILSQADLVIQRVCSAGATMRASLAIAAVAGLLALSGAGGLAADGDPMLDCLSEDNGRRISGCTALIEDSALGPAQKSLAYGMRALAYSLQGVFDKALSDYDKAIDLNPDFAVALNNRAWAYFKLGRGAEGVGDVEKALQLAPGSPFALDTRAHIRQADGDAEAALADYESAMRHGGERMVKVYQCGLRSQGLYFGMIDGIVSPAVSRALRACVGNRQCDPLPADEECKPSVS
jgi:tetratricopeptide (TPR) repeat protein